MIRLNILNMKEFLEVVNSCSKTVNLICPDGQKVKINGQSEIQAELTEAYRKNRNILTLCLDIPFPRDYLSIVNYYAGDR